MSQENLNPPEPNMVICPVCKGKKIHLIDDANTELVESLQDVIEILEWTPIASQKRVQRAAIVRATRAIEEVSEPCKTCDGNGEIGELFYDELFYDE